MPDTGQVIYWDANVFLSYVNEITDRMPVLDALLEIAADSRGATTLYTSELSRVEVAFASSEQKQRSLDEEIEQRIDSLWTDSGAVVLVEFHSGIAQTARTLMRHAITHGWSLKPYDAVHLATAEWLSTVGITVDEFHTYDKELVKYGSIVGFRITEPYTPQPRML